MNNYRYFDISDLEELPLPVAHSAKECLVSLNGPMGSNKTALNTFALTTLGLLHALGCAVRITHKTEFTDHTAPFSISVQKQWKWGSYAEIVKLWHEINPFLPTKARMPMEPSDRQIRPHFLSVLEQFASPNFHHSPERFDISLMNWSMELLTIIIQKELAFLNQWELIWCRASSMLSIRQERYPGIRFRGVFSSPYLCRCCPIEADLSAVFAVNSKDVYSTAPFCFYENVPVSSGKTLHPSIGVVTEITEDSAVYCMPEPGVCITDNKRHPSLITAMEKANNVPGIPADENWGLVWISIAKTRKLNSDNRWGYKFVDKLFAMIDKAAAKYAPGIVVNGANGPVAFPFRRKADEILIPFRYFQNISHSVKDAWEAAISEIIAGIVAETGLDNEALPDGVRIITSLCLKIGSRKYLTDDEFAGKILTEVNAIKTKIQNLGTPVEKDDERVLHLFRENPSSDWVTKTERFWSRTSCAAFAIMKKQDKYLLRWNKNHKRFNFIGGHLETIDGENYYRCLCREVLEELGIEIGNPHLIPENPGGLRLRFVEYSDHKKAWTCYVLNLFIIHLPEEWDEMNIQSKRPIKWLFEKELTNKGNQVSEFACKHILPELNMLNYRAIDS